MPKKKSPNNVRIRNSTAEFLTFAYQTGGDGVEVRVQDGTIWLSQKNIGLLFETTPENVLVHLKNIHAENELSEPATAKEFLEVQTEGKRQVQRSILHYNLDAIIAVGYRVNSKRATAFRKWATGVLRDYTLRGYVLDRKRMENGAFLDEDYFERLLEEIREIRLSERRFYQEGFWGRCLYSFIFRSGLHNEARVPWNHSGRVWNPPLRPFSRMDENSKTNGGKGQSCVFGHNNPYKSRKLAFRRIHGND